MKTSQFLTLLALCGFMHVGIAGCEGEVTTEELLEVDVEENDQEEADGEVNEDADEGPAIPEGFAFADIPFWKIEELGDEPIQWRNVHGVTETSGTPHYLLVGEGGAVATYDGIGVEFRNLGVDTAVLAGWEDEEGGMVVVGEEGIVRQWSASEERWGDGQPVGLPPSSSLGSMLSVFGTSPSNIYVGGENGEFYHWKGSTWLSMSGIAPVQGNETIDSIWVSDKDIVYVTTGERIYWGKSIEWQEIELKKAMKSLWGFASDDVYAVGGFGGTGFADSISHFSVQGWVSQQTPAPSAQGINDVWGPSAETVLAVGNYGLLLQLSNEDDGVWDVVSHTTTSQDYYALKNPTDPSVKDDDAAPIQATGLNLEAISGLNGDDVVILSQPTGADGGGRELIRFARHLIPEE